MQKRTRPSKNLRRSDAIVIKTAAFGITPQRAAAIARSVVKHRAVLAFLGKSRNRLLSFEILDPESETKPRSPSTHGRFCATFFDYTKNRTVYARGNVNRPSVLTLSESNLQPRPSQEEFDEAVGLLKRNREVSSLLKSKRMRPYQPMPPLIAEELPDGSIERTIAVGLLPAEGQRGHEIVGVNMIRKAVVRFEESDRSPPRSYPVPILASRRDFSRAIRLGVPDFSALPSRTNRSRLLDGLI